MVFIGEVKEFTFDPEQLCCLEGLQTLSNRHTEIFSTLDYHDWGFPVTYKVGRALTERALSNCVGAIPVRTAFLPVFKKQLFGSAVHAAEIKNAIVSYKGF